MHEDISWLDHAITVWFKTTSGTDGCNIIRGVNTVRIGGDIFNIILI
jgi:hypothetical protein